MGPPSSGAPATARWQAALAYALVGAELPLEEGRADPDAAVAALTDLGWTAERIGTHAREVVAAEQPWPHPVPQALRSGCGPAQFHAAVARARELLGLTTLEVRTPSRRTSLNADERRLLAEVPPHHVG
jgi:hypothetical protein